VKGESKKAEAKAKAKEKSNKKGYRIKRKGETLRDPQS
jgi:hypothetical protein